MVDVLGLVGIFAAFVVPGTIEYLKKPKLEIVPAPWSHPGKGVYPMTFASAEVRNRPLAWPFKFLSRRPAEACEVFIDFWTWGDEESRVRVFDTITGRWDSHPQPLQLTPVALPGGAPVGSAGGPAAPQAVLVQFDPSLDTAQHDIAVGSERGRISVAILRDGEAFAFANESYRHGISNHLGKPDWQLKKRTTYRIEVHVKGSNADHTQPFRLEFYSDDFAKFQLACIFRDLGSVA